MLKLLRNLHETEIKSSTKLTEEISLQFSVKFCVSLVALLFGVCLVMLPLVTKAASLYLSSPNSTVFLNDVFAVEVRLNLDQEKSINAVDVYLNYPANLLQVVDISYGNSILNIIPQQPAIDAQAGVIHFGGGITNGYTGKIPGDPGLSNLLTKIIFQVIETPVTSGPIQIVLDPKSTVFLNDGLGTPAQLSLNNFTLNITESPDNPNINEWQVTLSQDKIPPEAFSVKLSHNSLIYDNKYFITFNTTDKQTGLDHYEVKETQNRHETEHETTINWQRAESPYLLKDQSLKSIIKVKAVDKAGNEIIETMAPTGKYFSWWTIILMATTGIIIWLFIRKSKPKR